MRLSHHQSIKGTRENITMRNPLMAFAVVLILSACGGTKGVGEAHNNTVSEDQPSSAAPASTPDKPKDYKASPSDFKLSVKILSQECFGSAGCNQTWRIQINSTTDAVKVGTYEVSYTVTGLSDGPQDGTIQITDGEYETYDLEGFGSTNKRVKNIPVKVTSVETI